MSFFVLFHKVTHRPTQMERSQGDEELQLTVNSLIMEKLHDFFTFLDVSRNCDMAKQLEQWIR